MKQQVGTQYSPLIKQALDRTRELKSLRSIETDFLFIERQLLRLLFNRKVIGIIVLISLWKGRQLFPTVVTKIQSVLQEHVGTQWQRAQSVRTAGLCAEVPGFATRFVSVVRISSPYWLKQVLFSPLICSEFISEPQVSLSLLN